jgi:hypothetical protein
MKSEILICCLVAGKQTFVSTRYMSSISFQHIAKKPLGSHSIRMLQERVAVVHIDRLELHSFSVAIRRDDETHRDCEA